MLLSKSLVNALFLGFRGDVGCALLTVTAGLNGVCGRRGRSARTRWRRYPDQGAH